MQKIGSFTFVLHSHLPYVLSHGKWPHGTDWISEAAAETYIPLLNVFNRLLDEGIKPKVTVGITPILAEQLTDPVFKEELEHYLQIKINSAEKDKEQFSSDDNQRRAKLAVMWKDYYLKVMTDFKERYSKNIVGAFRELQDKGAIEIITSAATHGYLPLIGYDESVTAQIKAGIAAYKRHFGRAPQGIWLPECAYRPGYKWNFPVENIDKPYLRKGIDEILFENEIKYFIVDHHLLDRSKPIGVYLDRFKALKQLWAQFKKELEPSTSANKKFSPHEVYLVSSSDKNNAVGILTRDPSTGTQVWSGENGYPGDGNYLEFHKKHFPGGHRYWKVTSAKSDLGSKWEYDPSAIEPRIKENAGHFKDLVKKTLNNQFKDTGRPGILVAPYDSELFGHWWFEGPEWIYYVIKWINADPELELTTGSEYLNKNYPKEIISIPEGSWGEGGFHWIWFNDWTKWTWRHIYKAEKIMKKLAAKYADTNDLSLKRMLKQLARELLLLESSDWQFLISTWSARDYAELRVSKHYEDFMRIYKIIQKKTSNKDIDTGDWGFLDDCEKKDCIFSDLDIKWWT